MECRNVVAMAMKERQAADDSRAGPPVEDLLAGIRDAPKARG